jgi:hypothetical protein
MGNVGVMTGEPNAQRKEEGEWLIEPLTSAKSQLRIAIPEGAKLTSEFRTSLERFMRALALEAAQVDTPCPSLVDCSPPFSCGLGRCQRVFKGPCAVFVSCNIEAAI